MAKTDTGKVVLLCTVITLYSTGHWIGATVALIYLVASNSSAKDWLGL